MSFEVEDMVEQIEQLERRSVVFEDCDPAGLKTVDPICVLGSDETA